MRPGVIAAVVTLLAVGAAAPALAQAANLPPLLINSPEDVSVTQQGAAYFHAISLNDFLVVDDGDSDPTITCSIATAVDNSTKTITNSYSQEASAYGTVWELGDGTHAVLCTVTDEAGKTATATHRVSVDVQGELFPSSAAEQKIKRIARIFSSGVIDEDTYHLIIKYYHRAGLIDFDIVRDSSGGFTSRHNYSDYCYASGYDSYRSHAVDRWVGGRSSHDNVFYKQCLEQIAEYGGFDRLNLGF